MSQPHAPRPDSTRPAQGGAFAPGPWVLASMIVLAALSRVLPHPPNFSPVEAIALFGGAYFASRAASLVLPLLAMLLADIGLATLAGGTYSGYLFSSGMALVYACIALSTVLGWGLRGRVTGARVLGYGLAGSVLFFLVTNAGVWAGGSMYPRTLDGLIAAYVAGIPFFQWTVAGTLVYSALLFGGFELLRRRAPALRLQTV